MNKKSGFWESLLITMLIFSVIFLILEFISNEGCICYFGFNQALTSKIIGYVLLFISILLFTAWRTKKLSKWWIILSLIIFGIAFYGNGYKIFTMQGGCGYSVNKTTCFIINTEIGEFARDWGIDVDSLKTEKFKGKLLGYSILGNELTLYRIGEKPLNIKTSFLFWKVRPNIVIQRLSPDLHSYRNLEFEKSNNGYEFIGGKDMPIEVFFEEIVIEKNEFAGKKLINRKIINETDGTTRFRFELD